MFVDNKLGCWFVGAVCVGQGRGDSSAQPMGLCLRTFLVVASVAS